MMKQFAEIERKFLLKSFPIDFPLKQQFEIYQAYLSIDPEIRIRCKKMTGKEEEYFLTVKSNGELIRKEVELQISREHFCALAEMIPYCFIKKEFRVYQLLNGLDLECSLVDRGMSTEFMYGEIEFPNLDAAESFIPCFDYDEEITYCATCKMKNYWKRTRLKCTHCQGQNEIQIKRT